MWEVEFTSDAFLPYLPEEAQGNPGVYGFELALWLSQELAGRGIVTSYPLGEDWGWFIEQNDDVKEVVIGCASVTDPDEGYQNRPVQWRVFVRPAGFRSFFRRKASQPDLSALQAAIESVLRDAGLSFSHTEQTSSKSDAAD